MKDELKKKIDEYLKIPKVGEAIVDATDLIMRLRLGQLTKVTKIINHYCNLYQESKGVDIEEPLYKALELGEYIECYQKRGKCNKANKCWITRKGLCPKNRKRRNNKKKEK